MDLANKIKKMLETTQSEADKKVLEHYLTELKNGNEVTEEEIMENIKGLPSDMFTKFREQEMDVSKEAADRLMENWDTGRFSAKTSGSYIDREVEEAEETQGDSRFYDMSREDLLGYIFAEEEEAGEEALAKYTDEDLIEIAIEKSTKVKEEPAMVETKTRPQYRSLGLSAVINKLSNSSITEHTSFKVILTNYNNLLNVKHIPESLVIENFASELGNFEWDENVKAEKSLLEETINKHKAEIVVEKAIFSIKRDAGWKFYSGAADIMNEWLNSDDKSNRLLSKNLRPWAFNPVVGNLVNRLNEMEATEKGSLNIPAQQGESYVASVYSPVYLTEGNTYFSMNGKYFRANNEGVTTIDESSIDENFKSLVAAFNSEGVKINERGINYYLANGKVSLVTENEETAVYVDKTKLNFDNKSTLAKLLESNFSGLFGKNGAKVVSDILRLYENFENIVELDFIKSIKSRVYEGALVNLIKWDSKIFVNKVNPGMNENSLYASNGRQAVRFVKEFLNYDISEGLTEYLEGEDKVKAVMVNDRTKVLENITSVEQEIVKIDTATRHDSRLSESDEIKNAKKMLEDEITSLKEKWSIINSEISKIDSIDFEAIDSITEDEKFSIGSLVKIKESGDTGKVISIDGTSGRYTVLHDSGKTGDYQIDEIVDLADALDNARDTEDDTEGNAEDTNKEETTEEPVEVEDAAEEKE